MIGRVIANYIVVARLGEGATGEVYQARHRTLGHLVAIKFIRKDLMHGQDARQRFLREATLAAALDAPGICNVIDFGQDDDGVYLVMRYCPGSSLRDLLRRGPLALPQALLFAIQIAEGLAVAHAQGIVHRDIKPSNIVIGGVELQQCRASAGADGSTETIVPAAAGPQQARIIDFGLAFLPEHTRLTRYGASVGTPAYMAPEQITGGRVDARTDIWAVGALLHEMVTGSPPFGGDSAHAVMDAIRTRPPRLVIDPDPIVPARLAWIILRALEKDPDRRYPDATALLADLRSLYRSLSAGCRDLPSWVVARRHWLAWIAGLVAVIAGVVAGLVLLGPLAPGRGRGLPPGRPLPVTSGLTHDSQPVLSPDGSRVAYTGRVDGQADIYVVDAHGGEPLRLTADPHDDHSPAWFPDGSTLAFVSDRRGSQDIWTTNQHGGAATLLLADARDPAPSPDGQQLAFVRTDSLDHGRVGLVRLDDTSNQRLMTGRDDGLWGHREPAWSPDGRLLCYSSKNDLYVLDLADEVARRLTGGGREDREPCWSVDGRFVYFSSFRDNVWSLWRVRPGKDQAERLTLGSGAERHPSLDRSGRLLVYSTMSSARRDLVLEDRQRGGTVFLGIQGDGDFPSMTPDGRWLAFVSDRWDDRAQVWLQELDDGAPVGVPRRLTRQPGHASHTALSADGAWVAYYRFDGDRRDLWVVPTDGGEPRRLTDDPASDIQPAWSPDGARLAFSSDRTGTFAIWVLPIARGAAAGPPRCLTGPDLVARLPVWSPDGTEVAFTSRDDVYVVPVDGSTPPCRLTIGATADRLRWERRSGRIWMSARCGEPHMGLWTVSPEDGGVERVEPAVTLRTPERSLVFDIDASGTLLVRIDDSRAQGRIWMLEAEEGSF